MRLRLPELLAERGWTVYEFAKRAEPQGIAERQAYRLAAGEQKQIPLVTLDALCAIFGIKDPGPLFERDLKVAKGRR